ncbi:histidinol-phosphate aminotransferase [Abditibacterium utsteinense]|uniref:Histidinol-phosphate aminotransferase n=1 Tax=Abditibacterium utsteinense TaxID=1960156 RepID=A0A2S8SRR8_9BACT|nr:histidinol-phosphate transaminase [Abditibacterium utsteinense]PQV63490.1 histidinol-phosphate aminotransferase [Abditibacterium utsteinense]
MSSILEKSHQNGHSIDSSNGASCALDAQLVRQSVLKLKPYVPGKPIEEVKRELGLPADFSIIKLASNENVLGPSPKAISAMQNAAQDVWLYPDDTCFELKNALAAHWDLTSDHFIIGNGSDEILHFMALAFLDKERGDEVIFGSPSFVQYKACAMIADCAFHAVPLDGKMRHDLGAMKAKINDKTRLIFVCNPNNPTGTTISKAQFEDFLQDLPSHVVVVLDEAYAEYVEGDSPRARDYIYHHNVIALRTFSKAYAIAGTRVGYGLARPELIAFLQQVRGPFNVNTLAQVAAIAALGDQDHIAHSVEVNAAGRAQLQSAFEEMKLQYVPSQANFVLVNIGIDAAGSFNELLKRGVIVRTGTPFGLDTWLRVTIGTRAMNERFIAALREVINS